MPKSVLRARSTAYRILGSGKVCDETLLLEMLGGFTVEPGFAYGFSSAVALSYFSGFDCFRLSLCEASISAASYSFRRVASRSSMALT